MTTKIFPLLRRPLGVSLTLALLAFGFLSNAWAGPYSALVVEVESDRVLYERNPDELRHPASLTKMMTLYLLFEALSRGDLALDDTMGASAFAVSKPPSRLGLRAGETLTVEDGILGLVTQSANDAATIIAETLGGSEPAFAEMMTQKARQLGMSSTVFRNAQGLPDPAQVTTARDMYKLGKALIKHFPQYYGYFSTESFWFRDRNFHNHNHLLGKYQGADGIKTGFINSSGFNLVASAKRNGVRLIGVVFGGPTHSRRDAHMEDILDDGFAQIEGGESSNPVASFDNARSPALLRKPADIEREIAQQAEDGDRLGIKQAKLRGTLMEAKKELPLAAEKTRLAKEAAEEMDKSHGHKEKMAATKPSWEVRVGTFDQVKAAQQRLAEANKTAPFAFRNAKAAVMSHIHHGKKTYIPYFAGLTKEDADLACQSLKRKKLECSPSSSG